MKQSAIFSGDEVESTSLNFAELRDLGLDYVQNLSGDVWTDYNSHDPGVTILESLCYAITDLAYRTSLPVEDLLTPADGLPVVPKNNAFFTPSTIFSSHPVTLKDTRKMIIDQFEEIQNVWISAKKNSGYEEQSSGINQVEILPRLQFLNVLSSDSNQEEAFLNKVNIFLAENRNLGERYEKAILLKRQDINIQFDIYLLDHADIEITIAKLFLKLLEFIYCRVEYHSFNEMKEAGYTMEKAFAGPRLKNGFIKDDILQDRIETIHIDELQKLFSKVIGISKCDVKPFKINGIESKSITSEKGRFFHLLVDDNSKDTIDNRFDSIYDNMNVYLNNQKLSVLNRQKINDLFTETWSKKYRGYHIGKSLNEFFYNKLYGTYRNPAEYYSIQRHFPMIYGIGEEGLSQNEHAERRGKALQLKAYLMFFEQHLANHLAQLANLNEFFNIDFKQGKEKTYFAQWMHSIPEIDKLAKENISVIESYLEPKDVFFSRKNRIYNHLLARFGEDLNELPWKVSLSLNMIKNEDEFKKILLEQKSEFLLHLKKLSYNRAKGESFLPINSKDKNQKTFRKPSGLEQMILAKTGIPARGISLIPDFTGLKLKKLKEDPVNGIQELDRKYRHLKKDEVDGSDQEINADLPNATFGEIGLKTLFKETLDYKNYRLSIQEHPSDKIQVIFQKEKNRWVSLFECSTEKEAVQNIFRIMDYFIEKNTRSEGLYLVDHILLYDFLDESKYGYSFLDEYGNPMFQTILKESWCGSEEERDESLKKFYELGEDESAYSPGDGNWIINDKAGNTIASCKEGELDISKADLLKKTKSLIRLFNSSENGDGRLRYEEMEKIRLKGSLHDIEGNYGQRRLVFQRRLPTGKIINEDFFNLNISILMPDWPVRFQSDRFKDYITDLIRERLPAHISNEIFWLNANEMRVFEHKYHEWQNLKSELKSSKAHSIKMKSAAFKVYQQIIEIKKGK
jgi:hypothetical protein